MSAQTTFDSVKDAIEEIAKKLRESREKSQINEEKRAPIERVLVKWERKKRLRGLIVGP